MSYPQQYPPPEPRGLSRGQATGVGIAAWMYVILVGGPILLVILCCVGCFAFGGLGAMFGPTTPTPGHSPY